jgi:hypothetical protein
VFGGLIDKRGTREAAALHSEVSLRMIVRVNDIGSQGKGHRETKPKIMSLLDYY